MLKVREGGRQEIKCGQKLLEGQPGTCQEVRDCMLAADSESRNMQPQEKVACNRTG